MPATTATTTAKAMRNTVMTLTGIKFSTSARSIYRLYYDVYRRFGYSPMMLRFTVNGVALPQAEEIDWNRPLSHYGIIGNNTIFLILRLGGPVRAPLRLYRAEKYRRRSSSRIRK